jgi:hypothetical protein
MVPRYNKSKKIKNLCLPFVENHVPLIVPCLKLNPLIVGFNLGTHFAKFVVLYGGNFIKVHV